MTKAFHCFPDSKVSDQALEDELKKIKSGQINKNTSSGENKLNQKSDYSDESRTNQHEINEKYKNEKHQKIIISDQVDSRLGPGSMNNVPMNPLKALLYLKLLCVHPCLVTSEKDYPVYHAHLKVRPIIFE